MKMVTYNVNGLRQRVSQFGSLRKLLDSLDADIICFQETKLSRQELTADLAMADGYESFFSCTRTSVKGRVGYSGVATFCRVKSAFSSSEAALPAAAEEGFTGLLGNSHEIRKGEMPAVAEGLEEFGRDELLTLDSEGRCVITDHGHFVLFNIYGPRADCDDVERTQFKITFYKILQKRCESLIHCGRRILIVGDLNIAPASIDSCRAGPDFENDECRRWFRSMLVESGGPFVDVFRGKHPERKHAYTCWPQNTGAEEFNYGSRIDHVLCTKPCLHQEQSSQNHGFLTCHVIECDILEKFKRWKPGDTPRHKLNGKRSSKLEGSDHAPVCVSLTEISDIPDHSTPSLSTRYIPKLHGCQQTIVSLLMKRRLAEQSQSESEQASRAPSDENVQIDCCSGDVTGSLDCCNLPNSSENGCSSEIVKSQDDISQTSGPGSSCAVALNTISTSRSRHGKSATYLAPKKKARQNQASQLSLKSFFRKSSNHSDTVCSINTDISMDPTNSLLSNEKTTKSATCCDENNNQNEAVSPIASSQDEVELNGSGALGNASTGAALLEWQRIQHLMQKSIPLCKGHNEPCVARIVKKAGPNYGRRFFVCARAEGPASNPEANCNYFKWAGTKSKIK